MDIDKAIKEKQNKYEIKNIDNNFLYFLFGIFVFFLYFFYREKKIISITILFIFGDILLYLIDSKYEYYYYYIILCYFIISLIIDCFRIKYFIPFFAAMINENIKKYFFFINLLLTIDLNLYSLLFIFINIFFQLTQINDKEKNYLFIFFSLFLLLLIELNNQLFKICLYSFIILSLLIFVFFKFINMLIFGLVFICFYYCRTICNDNL